MTRRVPSPTWQQISRSIGLTIVIVLLVAFLISVYTGVVLDKSLTLAFLGIASALIGLPTGWQLVRRNGSSNGGH